MYCDNRAKFSMVTTRIACVKCISLMGVTSHDVGSFQSCSVSNIYDIIIHLPCVLLLPTYTYSVIFIQEFDEENLTYECVFLDMETL